VGRGWEYFSDHLIFALLGLVVMLHPKFLKSDHPSPVLQQTFFTYFVENIGKPEGSSDL